MLCRGERKEKGFKHSSGQKLFGIIRELSSPEIELEVDEKYSCSVTAGASFYKINGLSADEFPPIQTLKDEKKITISQEKFKGMLRQDVLRDFHG